MDSHQIQYILKSMLGLILFSLIAMSSFIPSVHSSPIQNHEESFRPISNPAVAAVQKQYKAEFANINQDVNQPHSAVVDEGYKTYNPNFVVNYQQLTRNGAEIVNVRPTRRTILSTLMAPIMSMRDQAMNLLSASLQGCNGGSLSMWCRFWGMFFK